MEKEFFEVFINNKYHPIQIFILTRQPKNIAKKTRGVKWVTFYREAPPIPDYITVIDTELNDNFEDKSK